MFKKIIMMFIIVTIFMVSNANTYGYTEKQKWDYCKSAISYKKHYTKSYGQYFKNINIYTTDISKKFLNKIKDKSFRCMGCYIIEDDVVEIYLNDWYFNNTIQTYDIIIREVMSHEIGHVIYQKKVIGNQLHLDMMLEYKHSLKKLSNTNENENFANLFREYELYNRTYPEFKVTTKVIKSIVDN